MTTEKRLEVEVKIRISDVEGIPGKLQKQSFILELPRHLEHNIIWHHPDIPLHSRGYLLRTRQAGERNLLALKKPPPRDSTKYKVREEIEFEFSDFAGMKEVLGCLGFDPYFIYQKYRSVYRKGSIRVMVDETPIGDFIEIEGNPRGIDQVARGLGFSPEQYIRSNYLALFRQAGHTGNMLFKVPDR